MDTYPSINWWPGNLRRYESRISFLQRFCELNRINLQRCREFFEIRLDDDRPLVEEEISRLAAVLNETPSTVRSVFSPSVVTGDFGGYGPTKIKEDWGKIRYCEACVQLGYHSRFHEIHWLAKCPFHLNDLKVAYAHNFTGANAAGRMATLGDLMRPVARSWPYARRRDRFALDEKRLALLEDWGTRVSVAARQLTIQKTLSGSRHKSSQEAFGQLRALESMPEDIEPLFENPGPPWRLQILRFPRSVRAEFEQLASHTDFSFVFDFYKGISAYSRTPPPFVAQCKAAKKSIEGRHLSCRCKWGMTRTSWESRWFEVNPNEWPQWSCECPFEVALDELESGWGKRGREFSSRTVEREQFRLVSLAREMHAVGLAISFRDGKVSPGPPTLSTAKDWHFCEWNRASPLTRLLDKAAEWELEARYRSLSLWLDGIQNGAEPEAAVDSIRRIGLCDVDGALALVRWKRTAKGKRGAGNVLTGDRDLQIAVRS